MSRENIERITREFVAREAALGKDGDRIALLLELTTTLVREIAETVFMKVQTEPGWTEETGQALADKALEEFVLTVTDMVRDNGGTVDMALDLGRAAAVAYGLRLKDLCGGYAQGGFA